MTEVLNCSECMGSGICLECGGTGVLVHYRVEVLCDNCLGAGVCQECLGEGSIELDLPTSDFEPDPEENSDWFERVVEEGEHAGERR